MRLITIQTPHGEGKKVVEIAFAAGIKEAAISETQTYRHGQNALTRDVVNIETATPLAKDFIEALMDASFYDRQSYSFSIRHPESLFASNPPSVEVHPVIRPTSEVYQDLYQYIKVTFSLVLRVFLSALLLSFGILEDFLPMIIAGLLFLPYHHCMIGISLGSVIKEWHFVRQALLALLISTILIFLAGVLVALTAEPPVQFEIKGSLLAGAVLAAVIGVAAALASVDDTGRRELIGLAAAAHISVYPAWAGLQIGFGNTDSPKLEEYTYSFLINLAILILSALLTYAVARTRGSGIRRFISGISR